MMDYREAQMYWIAARKRRGLSIAAMASSMSENVGYEVSRDQLANFEYKGTQPSIALWNAVERQIRLWKQEDGEAPRVQEEREAYEVDYTCSACSARVPGPLTGARYCLNCGAYYAFKICGGCEFVEKRKDAEFCAKCGRKFNEEA